MSISNSSLPRYEIKFIADPLEYDRVLNWLRQHHSCLQLEYPDRQVNNIYFDFLAFNTLLILKINFSNYIFQALEALFFTQKQNDIVDTGTCSVTS